MKSLCSLFEQFSKSYHRLLFTNSAGAFGRNYITKKPQERICLLGYERNYSGHSFRRRAATSAKLGGLAEEEIQLLGR